MERQRFEECIEACLDCARECENCATACLGEEDVTMMARCIMLDRECAEMCFTAAKIMAMNGEHAQEVCKVCADICEACANECAQHRSDHCQRCAGACRSCAEECRRMTAEFV